MMVFKLPKQLANTAVLACAECGNPVPNDMLDVAQKGHLGPCPVCGCEKLADNPYNALTYATTEEYEGIIGLAFTEDIFTFTKAVPFTPTVNTERKKKTHPLVELLAAALAAESA